MDGYPIASPPPIATLTIEGPEHLLSGLRQKTADNRDGTVTLRLRIAATDLPTDYAASPDGSFWRIGLPAPEQTERHNLRGIRQPLRDGPSGQVDLQLQVVGAGCPPNLLWGAANTECLFTLRLIAGLAPYPHLIHQGERTACLRRAVIACSDPQFQTWLLATGNKQGLPVPPLADADDAIGLTPDRTRQMQTTEMLYRMTGIHSRREILASNDAGERVEALLRAFREHIWTTTRLRQETEDQRRGLRLARPI